MADNASTAVRTVYPVMRYRNARAAIDWLTRVVGFTEKWVETDPDGTVVHAELLLETGMIMLGVVKEGLASSPGEGTYLAVSDVDVHFERAKAAGAEIAYGLRNADYGNGTREFGLRDLEGRPWYIGSYRP